VTEDELKQRFQTIEMRFRDIDTARAREREDQKREFATMLTAARKTIEDTIARSEPLTQMREILSINKEQMAILGEARDERVRRAERDRVAAEEKERAAAERAEKERLAAEEKADLDKRTAAALLEKRDRFERQMKIFAAATALVATLGGIAASCAGAFRTTPAAKDITHEHAP
jgi:hypothetical protein